MEPAPEHDPEPTPEAAPAAGPPQVERRPGGAHADAPDPQDEATRRRALRARGIVIAGIALILAATLNLADAGYGRDPSREFGERRAYNTVKRDVHDAFPLTGALVAGGIALIGIGRRMGRKAVARPS